MMQAGRIAAATGARLLAEMFPARIERGAGSPSIERVAYVPELVEVQLGGLAHLILVDARAPVSFFAYPSRESELVPGGCDTQELVGSDGDVLGSLEALAEMLGATSQEPALEGPSRPQRPSGALTAETVCQGIGAVLPEGAIVSDESQTSGLTLWANTSGAATP